MKRGILVFVILVLSIGIVGCGDETPSCAKDLPPVTTEPAPVIDNPLLAAEFVDDLVVNGSGTGALGYRGYIRISKEILKEVTVEEYYEFCKEHVKDSVKYLWVSIICDDGTGIQFEGTQYVIATYGKIDYEGVITEDVGYIRQKGNDFYYEGAEPLYHQIGNLKIHLADHMDIEEITEGMSRITLAHQKSFLTIYCLEDVSFYGKGSLDYVLRNQHKTLTADRGVVFNEKKSELRVVGFDVIGESYFMTNENGIRVLCEDFSFSDTWHTYTFMFTCYGEDNYWESYYSEFKKLISSIGYSGEAPKEFAFEDEG